MTDKNKIFAERLKRSRQRLETQAIGKFPLLTGMPEDRFKPFPLTEMEQAYWLGRSEHVLNGNIGIHGYFEVENNNLDIQRFIRAWQKLITQHDMLRAIVTENGEQVILENPPQCILPVSDLSSCTVDEIALKLKNIRTEMNHKIFDPTHWPWFDIRFSILPGGCTRIHISIDGWCLDGWSYQTLFRDLGHFYNHDTELSPVPILFRDYVLALKEFENYSRYQHDLEYWRERLKELPPAPELPLSGKLPAVTPEFKRHISNIEADAWKQLKEQCRKQNCTINSCLLAVFSEVLAFWAGSPRFTLTVPRFSRMEFHPAVYELVGQFSSFSLFEADCSSLISFAERVKETQARMWEDLQYETVSGIRVLREATKLFGNNNGLPRFPVVFTTAPERTVNGKRITPNLSLSSFGKPVYSLTQTPQVQLDCQYLEQDNELVLIWDVIKGHFPVGMIETMFEVFTDIVNKLAASSAAWDSCSIVELPIDQKNKRMLANDTAKPFPNDDVYTLFTKQVKKTPDAEAVVYNDIRLSYREFKERVDSLAAVLMEYGVKEGDRVAIYQKKGWSQIVSVFSILACGAAYVPLDVAFPNKRLEIILHDSEVGLILVAENSPLVPKGKNLPKSLLADKAALEKRKTKNLPKRSQSSITYLIYTSGSTGIPKGITVCDQGVVNVIHNTNKFFSMSAKDRIFNVTSLHHDLSVYDILGGLCAGATLILCGADDTRNAAHWLERIQSESVTFWNSVPAMMDMLLAMATGKGGIGDSLRLIVLGGDWIPMSLPAKLRTQAPNARLYSVGGPTEITVWNIFHEVSEKDEQFKSIPYGTPAANAQYYIRDVLGRERPDYAVGEMICAGTGISLGYWNDTQRNLQSFFTDEKSGQHVYATGDLGYWHPGGEIHFFGRNDGQIKINGMRIETAEIETILTRLPHIAETVVVIDNMMKIIAFIRLKLTNLTSEFDVSTILKDASEYLLPHMIPAHIEVIDLLPLTENGKIDHNRLRSIANSYHDISEKKQVSIEFTPFEQEIVNIWNEIGINTPESLDANFFSLGGDSLQAIRLSLALRKKYKVNLTVDVIFQYPSLAEQVDAISGFIAKQSDITEHIFAESIDGAAPMTNAQRRLWLLNCISPCETAYNLPFIIHLKGNLNIEALKMALNAVFNKHSILRSCFPMNKDGSDAQLAYVHSWSLPFSMEKCGLDAFSDIAIEEAQTIFDLDKGPLVFLRLLCHDAQTHTLFITFHHTIFDGWSIGLFLSDLSLAYGQACVGEKIHLTPLSISYADYAIWLHKGERAEQLKQGLEYWKQNLHGLETLVLPMDFTRPERQSYAGGLIHIDLPSEFVSKVGELAGQNGATVQHIFLSAFILMLSALSGQKDITVGVPIAGRTIPDIENVIGFFVNTVVIRLDLKGVHDGYSLIKKTRDTMKNAQHWQDISFSSIVEALAPQRDLSRNPLYQVSFDVQGSNLSSFSLSDIQAEFLEPPIETTHTDLDVTLYGDVSSGYKIYLTFATALFTLKTANSLLLRFRNILEMLVNNTQDSLISLHAITSSDIEYLESLSGSHIPIVDHNIASVIHKKMLEDPKTMALRYEDIVWNREQLWMRSTAIGQFLKGEGVIAGGCVILHMSRSLDWVAAIIATHRIGATVVFIDPTIPIYRAELTMDIVQPAFFLTSEVLSSQVMSIEQELDIEVDAIGGAFIIFTSGSTGRPKGVGLSHKNILNRLAWGDCLWPFGENENVCQKTSQAFVDVIAEIFAPLCAGVPLTIVPDIASMTPESLLQTLREYSSTRLTVVPSLLSELFAVGLCEQTTPNLRLILCSGERLAASLIAITRKKLPKVRIWNVYGSTEVSADVTACDVTEVMADPVPIGRVAANTSIFVIDKEGNLVPPGTSGRIVVEGSMVASGYIGIEQGGFFERDDTLAFDTGDIGRWRNDGMLEYHGRADRQVKIRGIRIEPAESESVINELDYVWTCAVSGLQNDTGEIQLCAMVVLTSEIVSITDLRAVLRTKLQENSIPSRWAFVNSLPRTDGGKVDWSDFDVASASMLEVIFQLPEGDIELCLEAMWQSLGCIDNIHRDSDFFLSGGHSLSAARLSTRIEKKWDIVFPLVNVFAYSTLRNMAFEIVRRSLVMKRILLPNVIIEEGVI